jgi:hypothetical protein
MKLALVVLAAALAGCATNSPEYVARQSNWDVCRLSMGGPHSSAAEAEAARRGLDCRPYYGAIQGQMQRESAVLQQMLAPRPAPAPAIAPAMYCRSYRVGNSVQTDCN